MFDAPGVVLGVNRRLFCLCVISKGTGEGERKRQRKRRERGDRAEREKVRGVRRKPVLFYTVRACC